MRPFYRMHALVVLAALPASALAQHEHQHDHALSEKLGHVTFVISCKAEARATFERGLALLHSFAYPEAAKTFAEVAAKDPTCRMAQWGRAPGTMTSRASGISRPQNL